jgi:hypothetical protein
MTLFSLPLVLPRSTHYSRLGIPPEASADEIRAAAARYDAKLKTGGASRQEMAEAHSVSLENSIVRAEQDARFPPLPLMRLVPAWEPIFDDRRAGLTALRREIEAFLLDAGEAVHHPTDMTRSDFTGDFTHNPLIDDWQTNQD